MNAFLVGLYLFTGPVYIAPPPTPSSRKYGLSKYDIQEYHNPYWTIGVGWNTPEDRKWSSRMELGHTSSPAVGDWGINSAKFQVEVHPWASR